jgi:hypothetical protein
MIEGKFEDSVSSEAVGFSASDFGFVIQALNDAAGEALPGAEIVENQLSVLTQRAGARCLATGIGEQTESLLIGESLNGGYSGSSTRW